MNLNKTHIYLLFLIIFSCSKDEYIESVSRIKDLSEVGNEFSRKYEMRLAFGKTLARALIEPELRNYIKEKSVYNDTIFNELVFSLIKHDKLPSGKTISELLYNYEDEEVKSIFGDSLQEILRINDPLISIKLPDIFTYVNWDAKNIVPLIGVETPTPLIMPHYGGKYMFYYYNGYQELISPQSSEPYDNIKYLYLMVKYSSDYILRGLL